MTLNDEQDESAAERVVRLSPRADVARELYMLSGNECAFPGCSERLINSKGQLIGEVCHIEGAKPGSARFNKSRTNEDRRAPSNLLLMCHKHHVETDDEDEFTVARMREFKALHEAKYRGAFESLEAQLEDQTLRVVATTPTTIKRFTDILDWPDEDYGPTLNEIRAYAETLATVPENPRALLAVVVNRSGKDQDVRALYEDVVQAVGARRDEVDRLLDVLLDRDLVWIDGPYYESPAKIVVRDPVGWPLVASLRDFCRETRTPIAALFGELQFGLLD